MLPMGTVMLSNLTTSTGLATKSLVVYVSQKWPITYIPPSNPLVSEPPICSNGTLLLLLLMLTGLLPLGSVRNEWESASSCAYSLSPL
jgi:hypothetical protein